MGLANGRSDSERGGDRPTWQMNWISIDRRERCMGSVERGIETVGRPRGAHVGWLLILAAALLLGGCGKKGRPVAPKQEPPPTAFALVHRIEEGGITLSWRTEWKAGETGFKVYRFKQPLSEPYCPTCPVPFTLAAEVSADAAKRDKAKGERVYSHSERLDGGFRYIYKVHAVMAGGGAGPDSEQVNFEHR